MITLIDLLRRSRLVQLWAPVFVWIGAIFYFSSRSDPLGFLPSSRHTLNIDKLAHMGEYAGLAALLHRALRGQRRVTQSETAHNPKPTYARQHLFTSALIALAYALSDEIHQELTPGRGFELADIGYDLAGILAALGMIWVRDIWK
jgi:VanZ family protein